MSEHRLWGGRFAGGPAEAFERLNASLPVDRRLWREDIDGSRAHARMLGACGIIPAADADAILSGLDVVYAEMASETFAFAPSDEDIHTAVERRLTEIAGDAGRRLHTGRSRNDQVVTDTLLWIRRACTTQSGAVKELAEALMARAAEHVDTILPGYTHMQRAQPVRLAHHLLAYVWMLVRDHRRLQVVVAATEECPLGSGALAGSGFPIDRAMVATELGFARPTPNSLDAVASRDAIGDYLAFAAQLGTHISRLGAELVLWSTEEFGFVTMPDAFASGSSMMPQKKNPDAAELARAKAHRLAAGFAALQGAIAGTPLTYNKDLQDDKTSLFEAADTIDLLLPAMTGMIQGVAFHTDRMAAACRGGAMGATDLADHLVRLGWPFRKAHEVVGAVVRAVLERGAGLDDATRAELDAAGLAGIDVPDLGAEACVESKAVPGGTAREMVLRQLDEARGEVAGW